MTEYNDEKHNDWLRKLHLQPSDLVYSSETYNLTFRFLDAQTLYEEHVGVIDEKAAQIFLQMSNLVSSAINTHKPGHRIVVVANVKKLTKISRLARKMLLRDLEQWEALFGIAFSEAGFLVRAIGYAITRKVQTLKVSFHASNNDAILEAQRLCKESPVEVQTPLLGALPLPAEDSVFTRLWRDNPKVLNVDGKSVRSLHLPHWRYKSEKTTAYVNFSVLDNQVLLVEVGGSIIGKDTDSYYPLQDQILNEIGANQIRLILDTRKVTWSDADSRRVGEQYYVNNQEKYIDVVLIASTFIRFIIKSFNVISRHSFINWRLADSVAQAYKIHIGEQTKDRTVYEEVLHDEPHLVLSELNQIILEQKDVIKQYHDHMDLLIQNITYSSWENILKPEPITFEKNDVFSDVYGAIKLMQTDYLELVAEREQATQKAEEANRLKNLFLARMSHDLRTPLNSILGFSELLMGTPRTSEEQQDVKMIYRSAEQLNLLINDLLEISSIEAGETKINLSIVDIGDVLNEIGHSHLKDANDKNLSLKIEVDNELPKLIQTDIKRIRQICSNLITNAIKYTDHGQVHLCAKRAKVSNPLSTSTLIIEVHDTGRGIPQAMHQAVFDPFRQVEETKLHPTEGKGLGLAICKYLTEALGGEIVVESQLNVGSLFRVSLPMTIIDENQPSMDITTPRLSGHILLVEDDNVNQMILERMLVRIGLSTTKADNGEEALRLLKLDAQKYSLILMDCQMPQMDGWRTTQIIRNEMRLNVPILAITAYAQKEDIQRSLDIGMNDYLVKPLKFKDLEGTLAKYLSSNVAQSASIL